jgi:tetrahydromethanopterin S-methyltransferase subunit C
MAEPDVAKARALVAGAARGAWLAVLVGIVLYAVGLAVLAVLTTYVPDFPVPIINKPLLEISGLVLRSMIVFKMLVLGWVTVAVFFSGWWRAL